MGGGGWDRDMTDASPLQAKHANGEHSWGINGETGKVVDMKEYDCTSREV